MQFLLEDRSLCYQHENILKICRVSTILESLKKNDDKFFECHVQRIKFFSPSTMIDSRNDYYPFFQLRTYLYILLKICLRPLSERDSTNWVFHRRKMRKNEKFTTTTPSSMISTKFSTHFHSLSLHPHCCSFILEPRLLKVENSAKRMDLTLFSSALLYKCGEKNRNNVQGVALVLSLFPLCC